MYLCPSTTLLSTFRNDFLLLIVVFCCLENEIRQATQAFRCFWHGIKLSSLAGECKSSLKCVRGRVWASASQRACAGEWGMGVTPLRFSIDSAVGLLTGLGEAQILGHRSTSVKCFPSFVAVGRMVTVNGCKELFLGDVGLIRAVVSPLREKD